MLRVIVVSEVADIQSVSQLLAQMTEIDFSFFFSRHFTSACIHILLQMNFLLHWPALNGMAWLKIRNNNKYEWSESGVFYFILFSNAFLWWCNWNWSSAPSKSKSIPFLALTKWCSKSDYSMVDTYCLHQWYQQHAIFINPHFDFIHFWFNSLRITFIFYWFWYSFIYFMFHFRNFASQMTTDNTKPIQERTEKHKCFDSFEYILTSSPSLISQFALNPKLNDGIQFIIENKKHSKTTTRSIKQKKRRTEFNEL